jgi:hypothetical protein
MQCQEWKAKSNQIANERREKRWKKLSDERLSVSSHHMSKVVGDR